MHGTYFDVLERAYLLNECSLSLLITTYIYVENNALIARDLEHNLSSTNYSRRIKKFYIGLKTHISI